MEDEVFLDNGKPSQCLIFVPSKCLVRLKETWKIKKDSEEKDRRNW